MFRLRPYQQEDAEEICKWFLEEGEFWKWGLDYYNAYPIAPKDIEEQYADLGDWDGLYPMTGVEENQVVSHLLLRFSQVENMVRFGFVVVDKTKRGRGIGREMLIRALYYAFLVLNVEKVTLGVLENNVSAQRLYEGLGFQKGGFQEKFPCRKERWKILEMELSASTFWEGFQNRVECDIVRKSIE